MFKIDLWRPVEIVYTWLGKMGVVMSLPNRLDAIERHLGKIEARLERLLRTVETQLADHHQHFLAILQNQEKIMSAMDDLNAAVARNTDAENSVIALLNGISQQLKDAVASNDPEKIKAVIAQLDANTEKAAAAVVANTPAG